MLKPLFRIEERLLLLPPNEQLAETTFELVNRQPADFGRWLPWIAKIKSPEDMRRFMKDARLFNLGGQRFTAFIEWRGNIVGSVAFARISKPHYRAELGYWLASEHRGRGLVTRSCGRLIKYGFEELQLQRIEIYTPPENQAARAIAQRLHFKREGLLRNHICIRDQFFNLEIYGLLAADWKKIQKKL